jgi:uncharacterized protein YbjT (DUF2867 family)
MNVVIFGATGMVGQGALRESLLDPGVKRVVTVGRRATGQQHPKLREVVHADLTDLTPIEPELTGLDACFYCLGVTSAGLSEAEYTRVTHDLAISAATTLARLNPAMTFLFVSGTAADSSEKGRVMWARVKGKTENALLRLPFKAVYVFRPAFIMPLHGIRSRTRLYRFFYAIAMPVAPLLKALFPNKVTTTEQIGRGMLRVAREGYATPILESRDLARL